MFKTRYRIVTDKYSGYEVQEYRWYYPFWCQVGFSNTHTTIEQAELWLKDRLKKPRCKPVQRYGVVVKEIDLNKL